jgi:hypothetical protein
VRAGKKSRLVLLGALLTIGFAATLAACSGPVASVSEVVAFHDTRAGEIPVALYLADANGRYVKANGEAEITIACRTCANIPYRQVLYRGMTRISPQFAQSAD